MYLNHSFLPDQLHGPPLIHVPGCVVLADVPSFVLLIKSHIQVQPSQTDVMKVLTNVNSHCTSRFVTATTKCTKFIVSLKIRKEKKKKGKIRKAEITNSSSAHCIDYCKMS